MAWETFERNRVVGISGDQPLDELSLALKKITAAYEERFSRKPTIAELLYAIETVIGSFPERYVADPEGLKLGEIIVKRSYDKDLDLMNDIKIKNYEGVYVENPSFGYHAILKCNSHNQENSEFEVIKIPVLEVRDKHLICEYEILCKEITEEIAESLIMNVLLGEFYDHAYQSEAKVINFLNLNSNNRHNISYTNVIETKNK